MLPHQDILLTDDAIWGFLQTFLSLSTHHTQTQPSLFPTPPTQIRLSYTATYLPSYTEQLSYTDQISYTYLPSYTDLPSYTEQHTQTQPSLFPTPPTQICLATEQILTTLRHNHPSSPLHLHRSA